MTILFKFKPVFFLLYLVISLTSNLVASHESVSRSDFDLQPFHIDLSSRVKRLKSLVDGSQLPNEQEFPGAGSSFGIDLDSLKGLQQKWLHDYDWNREQSNLNNYRQHTVKIEGLKVHFLHEKSKEKNAIPIMLLHGWPGSFQEFLPVIKPLTESASTSKGASISFDVIVPSLPGFTFSSAPPGGWTIDDTARIFNVLMTEVLGYSTYAVHGTDWAIRASHFVFIPFFPPTPQEIAAQNISLTPIGQVGVQRGAEWAVNGSAYFYQQTIQPNTIGYALYDNPLGQLSWIGHKFQIWSDPRAGTPPSQLTDTAILTSVSLYFLTRSFVSSIYIYAQNPHAFGFTYTKAATDAPMLFTAFQYNVAYWPKEYVEKVGNLVSYKERERGGHFSGLDNPPALIEDIREIGDYFEEN